ncbi:MAG: glycosyltransferase family 4 protein [Betaproteobacteria bacterium]|nr:glycosyltransferase family 4 protein [Betaproteobacteria bacterium]
MKNISQDDNLKIIFNAQSLLPPLTGIGFYTKHLIEEISQQPHVECLAGFLGRQLFDANELIIFCEKQEIRLSVGSANYINLHKKSASLKNLIKRLTRSVPGTYALRHYLREYVGGRKLSKLGSKGFIYHEPNYVPVSYPGRMVITVHDLSHIRYPQFHPPERVSFLNRHLPAALQRADRVLTDSHFVAQEIMDVFGTPAGKIAVTHLGADVASRSRSEEEEAATLQQFKLRQSGFVLSVATLEPRKNLERLIDGYAALPDALRRDYPLVLVGGGGWKNTSLLSRFEELEARGEAIRTGYLPRNQVLDLYASAALFAYPSLYEGFGLPVLEAFASGVPVLTSNISSLPEISGGAALEVDPLSVGAIAEGLRALLDDTALRRRHASLGIERAKAFSWKHCAEQTLAVYRQLA